MLKSIPVYNLDENGYYTYETHANEFCSAPDTYNIPFRAVVVKPDVAPGYRAKWCTEHNHDTALCTCEGHWEYEPIPVTLHHIDGNGFLLGSIESNVPLLGLKGENIPPDHIVTPLPTEIPSGATLRWNSIGRRWEFAFIGE